MPKYLISASYTIDGVKGLATDGGSRRRTAVQEMVQGLGGNLECLYFAFGKTDVYCIVELPDNTSAAAISLVVNAAGGAEASCTPLLTPEEIDQAKDMTVAYRRPGG